MDDNKGTSLVVVHTQKALDIIPKLNVKVEPVDLEDAKKYNMGLAEPTPLHKNRGKFFHDLGKKPIEQLLSKSLNNTNVLKTHLKQVLGKVIRKVRG